MTVVTLDIADLIGEQLDALVAEAAQYKRGWADSFGGGYTGPVWGHLTHPSVPSAAWSPSTDWSQGGPIIERERIGFDASAIEPGRWYAGYSGGAADAHTMVGPTPLVAAMRAFVRSKFGDQVELPV